MLVSHGSSWLDRRSQERSWTSFAVSIAATVALFASAFGAMRSVGVLGVEGSEREKPIVVQLAPPTIAPGPPRVIPRPSPPSTTMRAAPTVTEPAPVAATPGAVAPVEPQPRADTSTASRPVSAASPTIPVGIAPLPNPYSTIPMGPSRGGAPITTSGVTIGDKTPNTERYRDSVINSRLRSADVAAWMRHEATGRERAEMELSKHDAAKVAARTTTAGSREVHVSQGEGRGGEGAVGGAGSATSVALPLFSSGPSAAQRKKNEKIDAEYQLRLRRLQDLIIARRDSARLDSLRRDSLARIRKP
jgi:hypothetical protein